MVSGGGGLGEGVGVNKGRCDLGNGDCLDYIM